METPVYLNIERKVLSKALKGQIHHEMDFKLKTTQRNTELGMGVGNHEPKPIYRSKEMQ